MSKENKAKDYAQRVANSIIENALEAAYLEGFNAGVDSVEKPVTEIVEDGVKYIDLGLPSGTMWSMFLKGDKGTISYQKALKYNIPNKEQVDELIKNTKVVVEIIKNSDSIANIIGPNGSRLSWQMYGITESKKPNFDKVACWILSDEPENDNHASYLDIDLAGKITVQDEFIGFHMLLALVKPKE